MLLCSRCSTSSFFSACRCCSMPAPVVTMQSYDQFLHFSCNNPIYTKVLQHTPPSLCQTLAPLSTFPPTCPPGCNHLCNTAHVFLQHLCCKAQQSLPCLHSAAAILALSHHSCAPCGKWPYQMAFICLHCLCFHAS